MQIPGTMTTPRLRLDDGEQLLASHAGMRKKGLFGNRYGELCLTDRRVAFVKAIMRSGLISAAANARGAAPMLAFDRAALTGAAKVTIGKQPALELTGAGRTERFWLDEAAIDALVPLLATAAR